MAIGRRFERGARLAWALDRGGGYRDSGGVEWRFVRLDGLACPEGEGLDVEKIVESPSALPSVRVEPRPEGRVRFRAEVPLVVHAWGEIDPTLESPTEEVGYGSVVRAGPLLLAPLYAEQHESVEEGRFELPLPPAAVGEGPQRDSASDIQLYGRARKQVGLDWALCWLGTHLLAAAVSLAVAACAAPTSYRVGPGELVDWEIFAVLVIALGIVAFAAGAPLHFAMVRWQRTPGTWDAREDGGLGLPRFVAVPALAVTLLAAPVGAGILLSAALFAGCGRDGAASSVEAIAVGVGLAVPLTIAASSIAVFVSRRLHRVVLWFLGPPSRHMR